MLLRLGQGMSTSRLSQTILPMDIQGNLSSVVFDVDATQPGCYNGTADRLSNLSSSGTEHDFFLGSSTSAFGDPTFVGSVGAPSAYFNMDANNDGFMVVNGDINAVGQPTFFRDFHKGTEGKAVTIVECFRTPSDWTSGDNALLGTENNLALHGFKLIYTTGGAGGSDLRTKVSLIICDGASGITIDFPGSFLPNDKDIMLALTLEHTGTTTTATLRINGAHQRTNTATVTTTTDATGKMSLMNDDSFSYIATGTRFYAASGFNKALSDEEFETLAGIYELRHSRSYLDAPDISSLSAIHIRLHNYVGGSRTMSCQEIQVYDGGVKGVGTERFEALGFVNGAPGNGFADISAGEITSDSNFLSGTYVGRLTDGWAITFAHNGDGSHVGGLGIWAKFSAAVDLKQISMRFQSLDLNEQNMQDIIFLTDNDEYIYPISSPADLGDTDSSLDSPNTQAYTWLF